MLKNDVWTILYSAPEDGPKATTGDLTPPSGISVGRPLLDQALVRALEISEPERLLLPLLEAEQPWWQSSVAHLPETACLSQPLDRGSGIGLLVALVRIAKQDRDASVVLFTSDNLCEDAEALARAGLARLASDPGRIQLVGREPGQGTSGDGPWVVPQAPGAREVAGLVFEPSPATRDYLLDQGGVRATPVVVAKVSVLLAAYEQVRPDVVDQCLDALSTTSASVPGALDELYPFVDAIDFHREVLAAVPERLALERRGPPAQRTTWAADSASYRPSSTNSVAL